MVRIAQTMKYIIQNLPEVDGVSSIFLVFGERLHQVRVRHVSWDNIRQFVAWDNAKPQHPASGRPDHKQGIKPADNFRLGLHPSAAGSSDETEPFHVF